ncbi:MAG: AI-2E family transporter [Planctomycetaceae bacterium]
MTLKAGTVRFPRSVTIVAGLGAFMLVATLLYFGKAILIPITLAVLLTFLLSLPVTRLQRLGVPKLAAVVLVVATAFLALGSIGWLVTAQVLALAEELPDHERTITNKLRDVRSFQEGGVFEKVGAVFARASETVEAEQEAKAETEGVPVDEKQSFLFGMGPIPVVIREEEDLTESLVTYLTPLAEPLGTAGLVIVLVLFMLLKREDLRNRIVTLSGRTHLATTTKALNEAGRRIASYLMMQLIINVTYGIAVALGTWLLGVPYAMLWGVAATVLRYVPYVGPMVAAVLPVGYSLLTSHGWGQPLAVVGLIVVLELLSNNVMEPMLYGRGVGVSEVAVILGAIFWGWLWGPIGLVLATPLTACLVVAGRYMPALALFNRILGDAPEVEPNVVYYQRLLARDEEEAEEIFDEQVTRTSLAEACEQVIVPALESAKRDRMRGMIDESQERYIRESIAEHLEETPASLAAAAAEASEDAAAAEPGPADLPVVFCYGIADDEDEAAAAVLEAMLYDDDCELKTLSRDRLVSEIVEELRNARPVGLCLLGIPPGGVSHARSLCKRFHAALPELKIAVGRWGPPLTEKNQAALRKQGASYVGYTPSETREHVLSMTRLKPARKDSAVRKEPAAGV